MQRPQVPVDPLGKGSPMRWAGGPRPPTPETRARSLQAGWRPRRGGPRPSYLYPGAKAGKPSPAALPQVQGVPVQAGWSSLRVPTLTAPTHGATASLRQTQRPDRAGTEPPRKGQAPRTSAQQDALSHGKAHRRRLRAPGLEWNAQENHALNKHSFPIRARHGIPIIAPRGSAPVCACAHCGLKRPYPQPSEPEDSPLRPGAAGLTRHRGVSPLRSPVVPPLTTGGPRSRPDHSMSGPP